MLNIIKTAIVTIIISFISGLLLDYYKGLAPKILCIIQKGIDIYINKKRYVTYVICICNLSNKTIHELSINIHEAHTTLKSTNAIITRGLKFEAIIKDNSLDYYIPFLSKGDEFTVTVYLERENYINKMPVVSIRSPERFKQIDSEKKSKGTLIEFINNISSFKAEVIILFKKINIKYSKIIITLIFLMITSICGYKYFFYLPPTAESSISNNEASLLVNKSENITQNYSKDNITKNQNNYKSIYNKAQKSSVKAKNKESQDKQIDNTSNDTTINCTSNTSNVSAENNIANRTNNIVTNTIPKNYSNNTINNYSAENNTEKPNSNNSSENTVN